MAQTKEIWKYIPWYEGMYQVSNLGKVRSMERKVNSRYGIHRTVKQRVLKQATTKAGYKFVSLGRNNQKLVHRIVALAWIKNPKNKPCVNHNDGDKTNNKVSNLSWCTYSENEKHSYSVLGKKPNLSNLGNTGIKARDSKPVAQYSIDGKLVNVYGAASEAGRKLGFSQGRISCTARGEQKTCHGYVFKYIEKDEYFRYVSSFDIWETLPLFI